MDVWAGAVQYYPAFTYVGLKQVMLPRWLALQNGGTPSSQQDYLLQPYIKNDGVQHCPNQHTITMSNGTKVIYPQYALDLLPNLPGANIVAPDSGPFVGPGGRAEAAFTHPSTFMVIWEHNEAETHCEVWSDPTKPGHWDTSHTNGFAAAFADGHVKHWQPSQLTNQLVCYWDLPTTP